MARMLDVRNLRISFRTNNGTVKAVRDISFQLDKGETLAIVGESGSGKSVTARAMLGILAPNSIIESGEIIYDGKDLLKISEDEFHEYRGNKISMIFQDPMSSLNPIMKIGKQLTEAMILNGKSNQRSAKKAYNEKVKLLAECINEAVQGDKAAASKKTADMIAVLKKFTLAGNKLEEKFNAAYQNANSVVVDADILLLDMLKADPKAVKDEIKEIISEAKGSYHEFVINKNKDKLERLLDELNAAAEAYKGKNDNKKLEALINEVKKIAEEALAAPQPNFFSMGYYVTYNPKPDLTAYTVPELNSIMRKYLDDEFMSEFIKRASSGIRYSHERSIKAKKQVIDLFNEASHVFKSDKLDEKLVRDVAKKMSKAVNESIDRLAIHKDSTAYTFETSLMNLINTYFDGIPKNKKENKRFEKETIKRNKQIARGKNVSKVIPAVLVDFELVHENMKLLISRMEEHYKNQLAGVVGNGAAVSQQKNTEYDAMAVEMIDYIKSMSSAMVFTVTKRMAINKAMRLMEDVGIPEPKKRFKQYPFQFSGGMRQRIVIAIALAANPDILICDEPTTALDVTIQAQILELINDLKVKKQLSVIFITHDLGVVANMADRIAVMYAGKIVEYGTVDDIFYEPAHPYTWALLSSMPDLDTKEKLEAIPGTPPNMIYPPVGDAFAARNKYAMQIDFEQQPPLFEISETHSAATWLLHPSAPKVVPPKIVSERIERMKRLEAETNG